MPFQPLDKQTTREPTKMPKIPFSSYLVAQKKSGKTTLLLNLLMDKDYLKSKFNRIFWISPTASFDDKVMNLQNEKDLTCKNIELEQLEKKLRKTRNIIDEGTGDKDPKTLHFLEKLDLGFLLNLLADQKKIITTYGKIYADNILLVLDDSIQAKILKQKEFIDFLFKSRHFKLSVIFISQSYFALPKALRLNNSQLIIFETGNMKELNSIYQENNNGISWKEFKEMYIEVVKKDYAFLNINYDNPKKYRFIEGIDEFLVYD